MVILVASVTVENPEENRLIREQSVVTYLSLFFENDSGGLGGAQQSGTCGDPGEKSFHQVQ